MPIGIVNRTENNMTAQTFAPIITNNSQHNLAIELLKNEGIESFPDPHEFEITLFSKPLRDYMHEKGIRRNDAEFKKYVVQICKDKFPELRERIKSYIEEIEIDSRLTSLWRLKSHNYNFDSEELLFNNLINTEFDVEIDTEKYFLPGENKLEMKFNSNSKHCLVHQLIRQYISASVFLEVIGRYRTRIIPFIIGNHLENTGQVHLMIYLGWLNPLNIFSWQKVEQLGLKVASQMF